MVKNLLASVGDMGSIPGLGVSELALGAATPSSTVESRSCSYSAHVLQQLKPMHPCSATRETPTMKSPSTAPRKQPPLASTRETPEQQ